ncbi:hypothetical protein [Caulobacter vibrioides]|uniref:Uncharacterized protein n=1 Tax=Caulobacter phage S2B TaxID=2759120 RepID=A0AAE7ML50_9CAUD|nr:hypothetical protein [Caulobacter vibrioides]QOC54150.1 hypothetical protein [Caulobacter phage S2B]QXZ50176.1 hypothetical protein KZH45_09595 [Caulobacter vibrioides]
MSLSRITAALCALVAVGWFVIAAVQTDKLEEAEAQVTRLTQERDTANLIGTLRAEAADRDFKVAIAAAQANHRESVRLLNIPTPPPEERCKAASELVDEVIQKERQ